MLSSVAASTITNGLLPNLLHPTKGVFQALGRSLEGDIQVSGFNGKLANKTKLTKIMTKKVNKIMIFPAQHTVGLALFPGANGKIMLANETEQAVLLGAASSDPKNNQVWYFSQNTVVQSVLVPVATSEVTVFEETLSNRKTVDKFHHGHAFIVGDGHCFENQLDKDTKYKLFVFLVGAGLTDGTTPGRSPINNMLHTTLAQGRQEPLSFLIKHLTARSPAVIKSLQDITVTNKDEPRGAFLTIPKPLTLASSYIIETAGASLPAVKQALKPLIATVIVRKKAASVPNTNTNLPGGGGGSGMPRNSWNAHFITNSSSADATPAATGVGGQLKGDMCLAQCTLLNGMVSMTGVFSPPIWERSHTKMLKVNNVSSTSQEFCSLLAFALKEITSISDVYSSLTPSPAVH